MELGNDTITPEIVKDILSANFSNKEIQPYESNPLYSLTPLYINTLLSVDGLQANDHTRLLSIRNYIYQINHLEIPEVRKSEIFDTSVWFPTRTFNQFRKEIEDCSFVIHNTQYDLRTGQEGFYVAWLSKSDKGIHAIGEVPSKTVLNINESRFSLIFKNDTRYKIDGVGLRDSEKSVCMCITFYINSGDYKDERFIISDTFTDDVNDCRGISYINGILRIWGVANGKKYKSIELTNGVNNWWTVFIVWPSNDESMYRGRYYIYNSSQEKKIHGNFVSSRIELEEDVILLGSKNTRQSSFNGSIANIDIFRKDANIKLPEHLIKLIVNEQKVIINDRKLV